MTRSRRRSRAAGLAACLCVGGLLASFHPVGASAQSTPDALAGACVTAGGVADGCALAAAMGLATQAQLALLGGLGSEIPGTATTLGTRVQGGPRLSFAVRVGGSKGGLPDLGDPAGSVGATTLHADAAIGLFEGFRLVPTVGGFLSVDAIGRAAFVFLPDGEGYPSTTGVYGAGLRVGIFREGFTIPGVSASISRRFSSTAQAGIPDGPLVRVDPGVTSIRATVGKDLFAVEWLAGFGWDDFGGDVLANVSDGAAGRVELTAPVDASRRIWFASASMTFSIVLNVALEAGWAEGFDPVTGYTGGYDPTGRTLFAGASARLIL